MPRKKRRSLKDKLATQKQKAFIGREEQLAIFRVNFSGNASDDALYNIFNIYGQGGVGKSALSRQYERVAKENNALVAFFDLESDIKDIPALMAEIVRQLQTQNVKFSAFDKKYKSYRQEKEQLERDPEAPKGIEGTIGRTLTKVGMEELKKLPGGHLVEMLPTDAIAEHVGDVISFIRKKITNKDELELLLEPVKVLTPLFIEEVSECAEDKDICLIFDTYEVAFPKLDDWLRHIFNSQYGEFPENVLMVISGRDELSEKWSDFKSILHKIPLERFTEVEAIAFLKNQNITNESVIQTIVEISDRLPMLMVLLADKAPETPDQVAHASESAVERFLKWIPNTQEREIILATALPRAINQDIVEELMGVLEMDKKQCHHYYQLLNSQPFVQQRGDIKTYHPVVKDQMLRYQYQRSPRTWSKQHYALATYFENRAANLGLNTFQSQYTNDTWLQFTIEASYHRLCANFEKELPNVVEKMAIHWKNIIKEYDMLLWTDTIAKTGELVNEEKWSRFIQKGIAASIADEKEVAFIFFETINRQKWIKEPVAASFFYFQEACYTYDIKKSIELYKKAIELNPQDANFYLFLGFAYIEQEELNKAIKYIKIYQKSIELNSNSHLFAYLALILAYSAQSELKKAMKLLRKAIELLNPQDANTYNKFGYIYKELGDLSSAIEYFKKAIEIDPKDATSYNGLGSAYKEQGELTKAIVQFEKTIELNPQNLAAYNNLGSAYSDQGELEKAIAHYLKAIELNPQYADAYHSIGWIQLEKYFNLEKALSYFLRLGKFLIKI